MLPPTYELHTYIRSVQTGVQLTHTSDGIENLCREDQFAICEAGN